MLHLKNSRYLPKDANTILIDSRDLIYGMTAIIRDCRVSSKFIELDISVHKNNLELLLEKLTSIGKTDHARLIVEEEIEKGQLVEDGISYFNNERFWESHEALEGAWKQSKGSEKELIQGLILVAAALVHYQKNEDEISSPSVTKEEVPTEISRDLVIKETQRVKVENNNLTASISLKGAASV